MRLLNNIVVKKKYLFIFCVIFLLSLFIGVSYGYFVLSTGGYNASELLISELLYGIDIEEDGTERAIISNNEVIVPANEKLYFYVTVSSINKVDSKYTLAYKCSNDVVVKYTDRTDWKSEGFIQGYDENTYSKSIRIIIDNTNNSNSSTILFKVFGGYTFNSYTSINLGNGYLIIGGPYKEMVSSINGRLVDIVESETKCITESSNNCLYAGGTMSNYLQYPEDADKNNNIWRILGTYMDNGKVVTKLVSESKNISSVDEISISLSEFYKSLSDKEKNIYKTNKFNCLLDECISSSFENIGLLSTYEYERVGGFNSYLVPDSSYFALNNLSIQNVTKDGIKNTNGSTISGLRPSIYLNSDVKVTGNGTSTDPYIISQSSDINLVAYTLNGAETDKTYSWLLENKVVDSVKCEKGTKAIWNYDNNTITLSEVKIPDYCTVDFGEGYTVTTNVTGGSTSGPKQVGYNGSVMFNITANGDYTNRGATVNCTGSTKANATVDSTTGILTVSGVKSDQICTVTLNNSEKLYNQILADHSTRRTRTDFSSTFSEENTKTLFTATGENSKTTYYFAGNALDNWVYFGGFYWRIVRINEDNSVRLLYLGPDKDSGRPSEISKYNGIREEATEYAPKYAGYMYGTTTGSKENDRKNTVDSAIKEKVDLWYENNILQNYDGYVSKTAIFCNDRSSGSSTNYNNLSFYFIANFRATNPSYVCGVGYDGQLQSDASDLDKFSASTTGGGNGKLKYPVALLTADEATFAGMSNTKGTEATWISYSKTKRINYSFWTMTPHISGCGSSPYNKALCMKYIYSSSTEFAVYYMSSYTSYYIRPVLSLKSCVKTTGGDGTSDNPYTVSVDSSCSVALN